MPTYEFRCPDGTIIERSFKISEVPDSIPAPDGSGDAVRLISGGAALLFKGSGFYITDYGKDGKKDLREKQAAATKSDAPKSDGGTTPASGGTSGGTSGSTGGASGGSSGGSSGSGGSGSGGSSGGSSTGGSSSGGASSAS
ncbi:MAG: zinc ribbon domain-containing protein [Gemmatimonadetes bacterium]|nr:zinc ribbon domain-containing protein [Gemmatimonadota bacterium]